MAVRVEVRDDVAIVYATGTFTGGVETDELEATLRRIVEEQPRPKLLLNLSGTRLMLSLAIGVLAATHVAAGNRGGHFYVCGIRPGLMKVMETIKIPEVLNHFDDCEEALEDLAAR